MTADLNNDSIPDLALVNRNDSVVSILVGDGVGGFTLNTISAFIGGARSLAVGDLNGDGSPDLAVTNDSTTAILINQIPGLLEFFPLQFATIQGSTDYITIADVDRDGNQDLVYAEPEFSSVSVFLSLPSIVFEPPQLSFGNQPVGTFGPPQTMTVYNLDSVARLRVDDDRVTGAERDDFLISSDECEGRTIATEHTCEVRVRFGPSEEGERGAVLQVTDNAIEDAGAIPLNGTGVPTAAWRHRADRSDGRDRRHRGHRIHRSDGRNRLNRSDGRNRCNWSNRVDWRHGSNGRYRVDRCHRSNGSNRSNRRNGSNGRHRRNGEGNRVDWRNGSNRVDWRNGSNRRRLELPGRPVTPGRRDRPAIQDR